MVSEVMLQQTQVPRVIEKYKEFLKKFPTLRALAKAPLSDVLRVWSGLGYNRRGKYLRDAAKLVVEKHRGKVPVVYSELVELPGIGPYTAAAIRVFAYNEPDVLIETNIRAAFIDYFLPDTLKVHDRVLYVYAEKAAKGQDPREWHWALMDYGVHIKKLHKNPARRSAMYTRQSKFEGSLRQVRGAILRELHKGHQTEQRLRLNLNLEDVRPRRSNIAKNLEKALGGLAGDGLIVKENGKWGIS